MFNSITIDLIFFVVGIGELILQWATMNSWVSVIENIKYKFFYIGGPQIAHRVWRDYGKVNFSIYQLSFVRIFS